MHFYLEAVVNTPLSIRDRRLRPAPGPTGTEAQHIHRQAGSSVGKTWGRRPKVAGSALKTKICHRKECLPRNSLGEKEMDDSTLSAWFAARDTFLGLWGNRRNMGKGLKMAAECNHPDAKWLLSVFPPHLRVASSDDAKQALLDR